MADCLSEVVCYKEDEKGFIKSFLRLDKHWYRQTQSIGMEYTIGCRYTAEHIRLLVATSGDILSKYKVSFMNDQVYVTIRIAAQGKAQAA